MIESVLQCLTNLTEVTEVKNVSSIILITYLLTYKKSYLMCTAFLFLEIFENTNGFYTLIPFAENPDKVYTLFDTLHATGQQLHGSLWFLGLALIFSQFAIIQFKNNNGKSIRFWCGTMILFILLMAWDSFVNANTETYIWRNYENIVLCVHIGIALSFYRPRTIINNMVSKLRSIIANKFNLYAFTGF